MQLEQKRDLYIDTLRGICVIAVVFIHTVFWSGSSYVPDWVRNLSLLCDVPLFFFLTGCTMSIYSKVNPLKQIFKLAILFFFVVLIGQIIYLDFNLKYLLAPLMLSNAYVPHIKLLAGSYWFVPVYAAGLLSAKIMLDYLKHDLIKAFLFFVPAFYCYSYFTNSIYNIPSFLSRGEGGVSTQMLLFYIWLIILGYKTYNFNKKVVWFSLSFLGLLATVGFYFSIDNFYLQNYKFPVALPYITATMISIGIAMGFKRFIGANPFSYLGKNAICFYISQGISSSILFSIERLIHLNWLIKLPLCFMLNCLMAIIIGVMIVKLEPKLTSLIVKKN